MEYTTKITPIHPLEDDRVEHKFAELNNRRYHYVVGVPKHCEPKATVLCVHGFPDIWYGWRYIIPGLLEMGLRVIVPDLLGFGQTDAPTAATSDDELALYSCKRTAADMKDLLRQLDIHKAIMLGHDWGGVVVSRIYLWHPEIVSSLISVCTPFIPPFPEYISLQRMAEMAPNLRYQLELISPEFEKSFESNGALDVWFRAVYCGVGEKDGENLHLNAEAGNLCLNSELDHEYYVKQYSRHGMHGPLNWYKIGKVNFEEEKDLVFQGVRVPFLYVGADRDIYTPPSMGAGHEAFAEKLTSRNIDTGHWMPTQNPDALIAEVQEFLQMVGLVGDGSHEKVMASIGCLAPKH